MTNQTKHRQTSRAREFTAFVSSLAAESAVSVVYAIPVDIVHYCSKGHSPGPPSYRLIAQLAEVAVQEADVAVKGVDAYLYDAARHRERPPNLLWKRLPGQGRLWDLKMRAVITDIDKSLGAAQS